MNHNRSTALKRAVKNTGGGLKPALRDPNLALGFCHGSKHTAMEEACGHKVGEEVIVSKDDVESEYTGAPDFTEQDFTYLEDSGDAHESENDDLLQFAVDEVDT